MSVQELFQIEIWHGYILQILLAEIIYIGKPALRGKHPALRVCLFLPVFLALAVSVPKLIAHFCGGGFRSLTIFLLSMLFWYCCVDEPFHKILFYCIGAQLTQNLAYNMEGLFSQMVQERFGYIGWFLLSVLMMATVYFVCGRWYVKGFRRMHKEKDRNIFLFAIASSFYTFIIQYLFQVYGIDGYWITKLPMILCNIFGLCVLGEWLIISDKEQENLLLRTLIERERQQFEAISKNNEVISIKAHDLKHFVSQMSGKGLADPEELGEIQAALSVHDRKFDTGCSTLDILLAEKQLVCAENGIRLSVMTDGTSLGFLSTGDLAALFGNALDNAIECERGILPEELRYIALYISRHNNLVSLRVENYFNGELQLVDDLPVTTKEDQSLHGYGLKSIRYIVQKYGGTLSVRQENDLFLLQILLMMQK